jgi:protein-tyrosine-phosphatase
MAEAIAAERHEAPGFQFASAGVDAVEGSAPSPAAVRTCAEIGVDLSRKRARPLDGEAVAWADRIYVMTAAHRDRVLGDHPGAPVELLDPGGADIEDPYGLPDAVYREVRERIVAALGERGGAL